MAKATSNKQNNRADPLSKKDKKVASKKDVSKEAEEAEPSKDPKSSHLYTDDNPETTLKGTGFKDVETANKTIELVSKRSLTYQRQTINTMFNRAKHHPKKTDDIKAAQAVFDKWLRETYPKARSEQREFKPVLAKKTMEEVLPLLKQAKGVDTKFAELYVALEPRKRLANTLVDESQPGEADWDKARVTALSELVPEGKDVIAEERLWGEDGKPSTYHLSLIAWAWSPATEYKLLKAVRE
ncbi:hypothetical protein KVR01_000440 [Diaporthe batatas]|uniref:uncharacterized protein n=1 Tax=Diaporthe batatas TaxID=748121 RepID=UPI001D056E7A|nr:uncharacterized protein KVR01_000440 [Diaporthe batatas]KAG8169695.1 hypothetical protein KVR01_000440 [Diaporthe batatas]